MSNYLSVSLMCADLLNLEQQVRLLDKLGVDYFHIDMMDSLFVPNLTFGPDIVNSIRKITDIPFDIHLLMNSPITIIRSIDIRPGDIVSVHAECKENILEIAAFVKAKGAKFGLALNPDTPVQFIKKHLSYIDVVLIMLIVPGFAGSTMIHGIMDKVQKTKTFLLESGCENVDIEVDGSVNCERAHLMAGLGATIFVGGTAGVFQKGKPLSETIPAFYSCIQ